MITFRLVFHWRSTDSLLSEISILSEISFQNPEKNRRTYLKKFFSCTEDLESADINLFSEMWSNIVTREIIMRILCTEKNVWLKMNEPEGFNYTKYLSELRLSLEL